MYIKYKAMLTTLLIALAIGTGFALVLLIILLPARVQYLKIITIEAPASLVYDALRYQSQLMDWSAWPKETNSDYYTAQTDGVVGARTIYAKKGKRLATRR